MGWHKKKLIKIQAWEQNSHTKFIAKFTYKVHSKIHIMCLEVSNVPVVPCHAIFLSCWARPGRAHLLNVPCCVFFNRVVPCHFSLFVSCYVVSAHLLNHVVLCRLANLIV